jgi:hypothetical protein
VSLDGELSGSPSSGRTLGDAQEMEALKQAKAILSGAKFEEFLQH